MSDGGASLFRVGSIRAHSTADLHEAQADTDRVVSVFHGTHEDGPAFVGVYAEPLQGVVMSFGDARMLAKLLNRAADKAEAHR